MDLPEDLPEDLAEEPADLAAFRSAHILVCSSVDIFAGDLPVDLVEDDAEPAGGTLTGLDAREGDLPGDLTEDLAEDAATWSDLGVPLNLSPATRLPCDLTVDIRELDVPEEGEGTVGTEGSDGLDLSKPPRPPVPTVPSVPPRPSVRVDGTLTVEVGVLDNLSRLRRGAFLSGVRLDILNPKRIKRSTIKSSIDRQLFLFFPIQLND